MKEKSLCTGGLGGASLPCPFPVIGAIEPEPEQGLGGLFSGDLGEIFGSCAGQEGKGMILIRLVFLLPVQKAKAMQLPIC